MADRLEKKKQHRLRVLNRLYDETDGNTTAHLLADSFFASFAQDNISSDDAELAFQWLVGEGLAKWHGSLVMIEHAGVVEIEQSRESPAAGTDHFTPAVINQVQHFYGTVGGVQTGSNNVMNVAQQINAPAEILGHFAALRSEAQKLPEDKRVQAIELVDALEVETKTDKPRMVVLMAYVTSLTALINAAGPSLVAIIEWVKSLSR